jgi:hypothetical protein
MHEGEDRLSAFRKFDMSFRVTAKAERGEAAGVPPSEIDDLFESYGGFEFEYGLYRVHSKSNSRNWIPKIRSAFPAESEGITPFGQDWQGNQFAWRGGTKPAVLLFQIASGEAFEIADSLEVAHEDEFVDHAQEALNIGLWREWRSNGGGNPSADICVGYRIPLFLGGKDRLDNIEMSNLDVYWEITSQLRNQTRGLPPGTKISSIGLS